jgi:hypothetical protein
MKSEGVYFKKTQRQSFSFENNAAKVRIDPKNPWLQLHTLSSHGTARR